MRLQNKLTIGTAAVIAGASSCVLLSAAPAFALSGTGSESITAPVAVTTPAEVGSVAYTLPEFASSDSSGDIQNTPDGSQINISGTSYADGLNVYAEICDGVVPGSPDWTLAGDCDSQTTSSAAVVSNAGTFTLTGDNDSLIPFRGESPQDLFNCLATDDNPTATQTADGSSGGEADLDPTVPSWGSSTVTTKSHTATCQIRITYTPASYSATYDKFFPIVVSQTAPQASTPESPVTILLPIGAAVGIGVGGTVLYRKRRRTARGQLNPVHQIFRKGAKEKQC